MSGTPGADFPRANRVAQLTPAVCSCDNTDDGEDDGDQDGEGYGEGGGELIPK